MNLILFKKKGRWSRFSVAIVLCFLAPLLQAAPGDILYQSYFANSPNLSADWDVSSNNDVDVSAQTFLSSPSSAYLREGPQSLTLKASRAIAAAVPAATYSVWIRRGSDTFSENPDAGEDLRVEYLNSSNTWITLETFAGGGTPGEIYNRTYSLPTDALHNGLRLRFTVIAGNATNGDYWHVDDVVVTEAGLPIPVAEWRMDEIQWNGTANEVVDSSGNGVNGTAIGGAATNNATPAIAGSPGTCYYGEFDGLNDYVNVPGISNTLNATASLAFWINTTQTGSNTDWQAPGIAGVEENGGTDDIFWGWIDAAGRIGVSVGNDSTTKSVTSINNGVWHHVVLTRDHTAGTYTIYIDGTLNASGAIATGVIGNSYSSLGRVQNTGAAAPIYFRGSLDEVRIYNSVLSAAQVSAVMTETRPCPVVNICPVGITQGGLIGNYYNTTNFSGGIIGSRLDTTVNYDWANAAPGVSGVNADQFSVRWNGYIRATQTGSYLFQTVSDDGVRLTVNSQLLINNWTDHSSTTNTSAAINLVAGQVYPVLLEFYENGGQAEIRLRWQTPSSGSFVVIPQGPTVLGAGLYSCNTQVVSYYGISHSGSGLTCAAEPITITAYDVGNNPVNPTSGTSIVLSTAPGTGTWANGSGYTFTGSQSSVIKYLQQTTAGTLNINVTDGTATENSALDPNIVFTDVGLRFYGSTASTPLPNQVAGTLDGNTVVRAVQTSTDTGACVPRLQNATRAVNLAYECRNPAACSSGQTLTLNSAPVQSNNSGAAIVYSSVNLSFDANGFAAIPFNYSDVGLIRLHGQMNLPAQGNDPAVTISGTSSEFVVKPASLNVIAVETIAGSANPGTQQTGSGFVASGENFVVRVEGRNAAGNRTPAFGRETTPEGVQVAIDQLVFPVGGNIGALSNAGSFSPLLASPGVYQNSTLSWSEVGSIRVLPSLTDSNYLGAGVVTSVQSEIIGRFYPSRFDFVAGNASNSCTAGNFTYLSDPSITASYQIAARNVSGNTVANYDNTNLNYNTANVSVHGEDNNDGVDRSGRINVATGTWDDGLLTVNDTSASVNRLVDGSLNVVPDGPFSNFVISLGLNDIDGATFSSLDAKPNDTNNCVVDGDCSTRQLTGNLDLRFGRMRVEDAHGPESADIPMQWYMEYWDGSGFVLNSDDHCTQLPFSALTFVGASSSVDPVNDIITVTSGGISSAFNFGDPIGGSDCMSASAIGFCDGRAGTAFGATGSIISYPIDFNLIGLDFLQGDWNQDGSYDDTTHPRVNINFQHYRGNDRVIYWRERLQ